jgi:hypothetical protein
MMRTTRTRTARRAAWCAVPLFAAAVALSTAPAASAADPTFAFDWKIDASTHLAKLNQTVVVPQGSFVGTVNLATGALTGDITLPPATSTVKLVGLPLATATFQMTQVQPVSGHVDFATLQATATAVFNIRVVRASPVGLPFLNLVGNSCTTSTPVSVTMSGPANLAGPSTFSGTYTIPPLKSCGLATTALNLTVAGPGNTFTATATPR